MPITMTTDKKSVLKAIIRKIHEGEDPERVKREFAEALQGTTPLEVAQAEEELIREGMPREEIQKLCEVHLAMFKEGLEREQSIAPPGHPIHTLMEEHKILLATAQELQFLSGRIAKNRELPDVPTTSRLQQLVGMLRDSASHYLREENVLFPVLERHGITEPPKVMWMEHDQIRSIEKRIYAAVPEDFQAPIKRIQEIEAAAVELYQTLSSHFYKENKILFPTALKIFSEAEWAQVRSEFGDIGYCSFTPTTAKAEVQVTMPTPTPTTTADEVVLESGTVSRQALQAILNTLPVDITFVDENDRVRYFNETAHRIFVRSRAVIGRSVQLCHPQKSIHIVNQILQDFRDKKRDYAEFWIDLKGRLIHIRYFAVRDPNGKYLGCLEVTQDITEIKKIEGEKRLLDEVK